MTNISTKLELHGDRIEIAVDQASGIIVDIFSSLGCHNDISLAITEHLIDANLCGLESHGANFRILEYIPVPERKDVLIEPLEIKEGAFALPTKPGLGVELNKEVFDQYVYKPRDLDHFDPVREIVL